MDPVKRQLTTWLYRVILESPRAHALLLRTYWASEAFHHRFAWFNRPELVEDADLQRLMRQHFADEDNHAMFFAQALRFKGIPVTPPPIELDYLVQLAAAFWDAGILVGETIEDLQGPGLFTDVQNLFVQLAFKDLSEKKAIHEFHLWRDLAKTRDPETHVILKRVVEDEDWHVQIFDAQVHRFLADPVHGPRLKPVYARLRKEARRMADRVGSTFLHHLLDEGLLDVTPGEARRIRALARLMGLGKGALPMASARRLEAMQTPLAQASA